MKKTKSKLWKNYWLKSDPWYTCSSVLCLKLKRPQHQRHLLLERWTNAWIQNFEVLSAFSFEFLKSYIFFSINVSILNISKEFHTSAPLKRKRIVFFKAVSDCVMTSRTSSIIAQLTASSLAPGLWGTESKWQLTEKK